ncbi:MAG: sulfur carrier protein ThiS [Cyanobacteria bacterium SZAS LIN-5]|nr:sulfur carrier protein ThiS [Cyanobacteria bacterium SZAS LIN-5]RTL41494.1 MAG: sulfur carrier protein ThiS [Candidatus Melainabacteria bacterium]
MQLTINGQQADVPAKTLDELLLLLGHTDRWFAVALDGMHIPRDVWSHTELREFQAVEILSPMQGG